MTESAAQDARRRSGLWIEIDAAAQALRLMDGDRVLGSYPVSTAAKGLGEREGTNQTPRGWHVVRAKVGAGAPAGTVFAGRRPTGEVHTPELQAAYPGRDWILSRILWLSGLEPGRNRLGDVDSMRRYIYIHGCPDGTPLGVPGSKGCVRMSNEQVIELFGKVPVGTPVLIRDGSGE